MGGLLGRLNMCAVYVQGVVGGRLEFCDTMLAIVCRAAFPQPPEQCGVGLEVRSRSGLGLVHLCDAVSRRFGLASGSKCKSSYKGVAGSFSLPLAPDTNQLTPPACERCHDRLRNVENGTEPFGGRICTVEPCNVTQSNRSGALCGAVCLRAPQPLKIEESPVVDFC